MKKIYLFSRIFFLIFIMAFISSCTGQPNSKALKSDISGLAFPIDNDPQIAQYVVEIFEDSKGNLWFGTMSKGAARYDGKKLSYSTTEDGLADNAAVGFAEDNAGNFWIATHSGLSMFDGKTFTNFNEKDGLPHFRVSNLLYDSRGDLWVGTWGGVCKFDGNTFTSFPLPIPEVDLLNYQTTMDWITEIMEDSQGNIWIGRDGYGVCKYDPSAESFTHFTKKDGLASNNVQVIQEDDHGNIWFGSRVTEKDHPNPDKRIGEGGLTRYDGDAFLQYPAINGLHQNDIYAISKDGSGNIWIGANGIGAYRFDGQVFTLFSETDRADIMTYGIQSILEDKNGKIWFGVSGGLFRLDGSTFKNVTQSGPWE